jgi:hypothetical protein
MTNRYTEEGAGRVDSMKIIYSSTEEYPRAYASRREDSISKREVTLSPDDGWFSGVPGN